MLTIRGIEVTQGIQYYRADQHLTDPADRGPDNSLTLVANKPAWVRVYLEASTPGTIPNVTGKLKVDYGFLNMQSGPGITLNPQPPGQVTAQFAPDYVTTRTWIGGSLNFIIPEEWVFGPLVLNVSVTSGDGKETATQSLYISASLRQTLRLRGIMIGYNGPDPNNPVNNLIIAAPGLAELQNTAAWALRVMPVQSNADFQVASTLTRSMALTGTATNGGCATGWISLNAAIATAKTADGNHPGFLYYGLIAATFPNLSNNGGCESSGVSSGFDTGQVALAHEVGHACGRAHAPCGGVGTSADPSYPAYEPYDTPAARVASIGEFGLDITTGAVPTPTTARDYMSYCGPGWISIYGHRALINNAALNPEQIGYRRPWWRDYVVYDPWWWLHYKPDPPPYWIDPESIRELPSRMQRVIAVTGILHADERVEVLHVTRSEVLSTTLSGHETGLAVVLHGAKGAELASAPLVEMVSQGECGCGGQAAPARPSMFQAFVPDVAVGSALSIRGGQKTLWKRVAPSGTLSASQPKVQPESGGKARVAWSARWPRGAVKDAWLRVSADNGLTWRAVATGLAGNDTLIDLTHLPSGKLLLQIVVHDGFRSIASKPVELENKTTPPTPAILHPYPKQRLVVGETLFLWGSVARQPGQSREEYRYTWTLDGKHAGNGLQVFTQVPAAGSHRCELSVQDAKGKVLRKCQVDFVSLLAEDAKA